MTMTADDVIATLQTATEKTRLHNRQIVESLTWLTDNLPKERVTPSVHLECHNIRNRVIGYHTDMPDDPDMLTAITPDPSPALTTALGYAQQIREIERALRWETYLNQILVPALGWFVYVLADAHVNPTVRDALDAARDILDAAPSPTSIISLSGPPTMNERIALTDARDARDAQGSTNVLMDVLDSTSGTFTDRHQPPAPHRPPSKTPRNQSDD